MRLKLSVVVLLVILLVSGVVMGKKFLIGVSIPAADHGWTGGVVWWANKAVADWKAKDSELEFKVVLANNPSDQVADVEDLLVQGIDALVILPYESAPLTPICEEVHKKGIYLVVVDRGLTKDVYDVYVAGDNYAFGKNAAEYIAKKLNGKGNVVVLEGIPSVINTERVNGFMDVMKDYPNIKILASQPGYWQRDKALAVMENYLQKFPKIDAVWAADDDMALGVIQAIKEAGREKEMFVVGGGGMKDVIKMIMDGSELIPVTVTYPPSMVATAISMAVKGLKGEKLDGFYQEAIPHKIILSCEIVTKENAEKYYYPDSVY